ncbi:MAG: hypothetical protein H0X49_01580 [Acidobacteria bacterium]|nr:hypothetical protein [Acidobacteriota bacterium]
MSAEFKETNRKIKKTEKPLKNIKRLFCVQSINDNGSLSRCFFPCGGRESLVERRFGDVVRVVRQSFHRHGENHFEDVLFGVSGIEKSRDFVRFDKAAFFRDRKKSQRKSGKFKQSSAARKLSAKTTGSV